MDKTLSLLLAKVPPLKTFQGLLGVVPPHPQINMFNVHGLLLVTLIMLVNEDGLSHMLDFTMFGLKELLGLYVLNDYVHIKLKCLVASSYIMASIHPL